MEARAEPLLELYQSPEGRNHQAAVQGWQATRISVLRLVPNSRLYYVAVGTH